LGLKYGARVLQGKREAQSPETAEEVEEEERQSRSQRVVPEMEARSRAYLQKQDC